MGARGCWGWGWWCRAAGGEGRRWWWVCGAGGGWSRWRRRCTERVEGEISGGGCAGRRKGLWRWSRGGAQGGWLWGNVGGGGCGGARSLWGRLVVDGGEFMGVAVRAGRAHGPSRWVAGKSVVGVTFVHLGERVGRRELSWLAS